MSVYQLRTFADIINAVREELQISSVDTTAINRLKRDANIVYSEITSEKNWWWLNGSQTVQIPAFISAGTVEVLAGSADITLSVAPAASQAGKLFATDGFSEIYTIESHTAGSTSAKLSELYAGASNAASTYKLWTDRIPLPTDCKETTSIWHEYNAIPVEARGKLDYRKLVASAPRLEGKPRYYYTGDFIDPVPTSAVTSMPTALTRASAGVVKTIVFNAAIPTAVVTALTNGAALRWKISGASQPSYNGDIVVSSISTTTITNDTITYTGKAELQEPATSDTSISVRQIDTEADYDRYRELHLYPCLNRARVTLHVDYVKEVFPLENDDDEPAIPYQDRAVLVYGTLARAWSRQSNETQAARNAALYETKLAKMAGKIQDTLDTPKLSPSKLYLGSKRNAARRSMLESAFAPGEGSAGGSSVATGVAGRAAQFNSITGELEASTTVTDTELGYLDGATSNIQAQIDASNALADGAIWIGNASDDAVAIVPTGDVTITNAGVTAIAAGAIVNADINSAAAIAYPKLNLSASIVNADIASGAAIAYSKLNLTGAILNADLAGSIAYSKLVLTDSIVNADIASAAAIAYSKLNLATSIVNADINASAAIAYSKLNLTGAILNADLAGSIAYSKLSLSNSIVNADVSASAAIAYSKLNLTGAILNADLAGSIAYSKLTLTNSVVNADIASAAAIAYSKLNLATSIVNADIASGAAIVYSKLSLSNSIVNADINSSAAIAYSKLNLATSIVNADVSTSAAIAYSKLNLATSIVNADVSTSAAIAYSKLNLATSIVNADIAAGAAIAFSKLATLTSANILVGNVSNVATAVAVTGDISLSNAGVTAYAGTVPILKGGTGQTTANASFNALAPSQASASGKYLTSNGTDTSWATVSTPATVQVSKSANYTLLTSEDIASFTTGASALTATLPTAVGNQGKVFRVDKVDTGAGTVAVATTSSQTMGYRTSSDIVLARKGDYLEVYSDNANWQIIGKRETKTMTSAPGATAALSGSKYVDCSCTLTLGLGRWAIIGQFTVNTASSTAANINLLVGSGFFGAVGTGTTVAPTALGGTINGDVTWSSQEPNFIIIPSGAGSNSRVQAGFNKIIVEVTSGTQRIDLVPKTDWSGSAFNVTPYMFAERLF